MALTNFVDKVTSVTASWLNSIDVLWSTVFGEAATKAAARAALTSDAPMSVGQGGTGAITAGAARTALGSTATGDALFTAATAAAALATLGAVSTARQITAGTGLLGGGDLTADRTLSFDVSYIRNYLSGLTLSNDGVSPNTVLDIAVGVAMDSTNAFLMKLASAFTKTTAAFVAGTGNGGLDTGAVANNTWYHVYLIRKTADGTIDVCFSTNATSPTVTGYGAWRRVGSFKTASASTNILAFTQRGDEFRWVDPIVEFASTTQGNASRDTRTYVGVPLGIVTLGHFIGSAATTAAATGYMYFTDLTQTDTAADINHSSATTSPVAGSLTGFDIYVYTNTAQQIGTRANAATNQLSMTTMGWIDRRGK